ncbi:hypothetical protein KUCAC02_008833 [Chaenocephalus aceratus]|uniref:Uncharacterized protein n=1 Tax=Chaenocephalus aceratus TaxID=36190 RepID=A0ACB9WRQ3_CHAAC|nr:hypothetical protein KUCAC02_008833 [Chaenocephalus aceratus]
MAEGQSSNSSMEILKPDILHNGKKNSDVADGGESSKRSREMTEGLASRKCQCKLSSGRPLTPGPPYPAPSSTGPSYPEPSYPGQSSTGPPYPAPSSTGPPYPAPSSTGPPTLHLPLLDPHTLNPPTLDSPLLDPPTLHLPLLDPPTLHLPLLDPPTLHLPLLDPHSLDPPTLDPPPLHPLPQHPLPQYPPPLDPSSSAPSSSAPSSSGPSSSAPSSSVPSSSGPSSSVPSSSEPSSSQDVDMKRIAQCDNTLGPLHFSKMHTVLVDVDVFNCGAGTIPQDGRDVWHNDFVKMPFSLSSHMKTGYTKQTNTVRWEVIYKQLRSLSKKKTASVKDLEDAIINITQSTKADPNGSNYSPTLFQKIAELALRLPELVKKAVPLLKRGHPAAITLSQTQIACLLANAFFCTYPHRNFSGPKAEYHNYPSINFTSLFGNSSSRKEQKLRAIMHYFQEVTAKKLTTGLVTFERRCLKDTDLPNWRSCKKKMHKLHVASHGTIENEGEGMLQVDFASSWIGGGVLGSGLVQEEILFIINPELIVSRLFTEKLGTRSAPSSFSNYSGFGDTFEWKDPHEERLNRDEWARLQRQIVAIDALHFKHRSEQYNMIDVTRELNKAYCGFKAHQSNEPDIATGNWGCGAFNGDKQLKAVIQLMAAAQAERDLAFFTFEDEV